MTITLKKIESLVNTLNTLTNNPLTPYTWVDNKYLPNAGNYHTEQAYGGIKLIQMCETGTGTRDISKDGFGTKKQLYTFLKAFIQGLTLQS